MRTEKYESPKFDFKEMRLLERVADVCWGKSHRAWFDADRDGIRDPNEKIFEVSGNSCDDAGTKLIELLEAEGYIYTGKDKTQEVGKFNWQDVHENVNSSVVMEIYS